MLTPATVMLNLRRRLRQGCQVALESGQLSAKLAILIVVSVNCTQQVGTTEQPWRRRRWREVVVMEVMVWAAAAGVAAEMGRERSLMSGTEPLMTGDVDITTSCASAASPTRRRAL